MKNFKEILEKNTIIAILTKSRLQGKIPEINGILKKVFDINN